MAKEYIWLPGAGYAGTDPGSGSGASLPVGVVDVAGTATPELLYVHADHLSRPTRLTDAAKVTAWAVEWLPWGGVNSITGSETLNARFPGQWFQVESGLHYNWHRHYNPTIGRYTQPDPLGFVDGPSMYAFARNAPGEVVDPDGRLVQFIVPMIIRAALTGAALDAGYQFGRNVLSDKQSPGQALRCINLATLPYSALGGAAGSRLYVMGIGRRSFGGRVILGAGAIGGAGRMVAPPITLNDIINPSDAGDIRNPCSCSRPR